MGFPTPPPDHVHLGLVLPLKSLAQADSSLFLLQPGSPVTDMWTSSFAFFAALEAPCIVKLCDACRNTSESLRLLALGISSDGNEPPGLGTLTPCCS